MRKKWDVWKPCRPNPWLRGIFSLLIVCTLAAVALAQTPNPPAPGEKVDCIDQKALDATLDKALERHLAPVKEMLTELTIHQTSLTDILGGIGYILGFFGIWAYFQSKKRKDS